VCKECKGTSICEHGRIKRMCKECGGSSICKHGNIKYHCKECCGSSICKHGKVKYYCKECGGSSICQHGKDKYHCKQCSGPNFCHHNKEKYKCRECGGSCFCQHGREKHRCKACGGASICQHGRLKQICKDCCGSKICNHGRYKHFCKDCGGSRICEHGKQKQCCKDCGGSRICEHGVQKHHCSFCGYKCISCNINVVNKKGSSCRHCLPIAKKKSRCKEARIAAELGSWTSEGVIPIYTSWNKTNPDATRATCGAFRPDFVWDMKFRVVILEVDEFQHKNENYTPRCEHVRISRIVEGFGGIPVHIIRYNPDAFKINGVTRRTTYQERIALLKIKLAEALAKPDFEHRIVIQHIFFDQDSDATDLVTTQYFKTLEEYEELVERVEP